jgi:hypothetical protein
MASPWIQVGQERGRGVGFGFLPDLDPRLTNLDTQLR